MKPGLITIVIPVYNHAKRLACSLSSVAEQTYPDIEMIVVNDGSTDDFHGEIKKIKDSERFKKIVFRVIDQENMGAPAARNRGFKEAAGEFVIFWDADLVAKPGMLSKMKQALDENPSASYAYSQFRFGWKKFGLHPFDSNLLKKNNYITTSSLIRSVDFPSFDESLKRFQDWDLWLTLLEKNKTGIFIPEILFEIKVSGRAGISTWLPSIIYKMPFKLPAVKKYEEARRVILQKHGLA